MFGKFRSNSLTGRGPADQGARAGRWEGLAFTGAYVFALTVALWALLSSKHETRSLLAWLVFVVFALCMTGILVLYRKAAKGGANHGDWPGSAAGNDTSQSDL